MLSYYYYTPRHMYVIICTYIAWFVCVWVWRVARMKSSYDWLCVFSSACYFHVDTQTHYHNTRPIDQKFSWISVSNLISDR